ncbi:MAG: metallophosphoesterase [Spirochaetaceae bacterium]|jgi:putative phosphoesterase|nr:metallophosphoesterase [Spirochaetaceae bacterium]
MNVLEQLDSNLIGSKEAAAALESAPGARLLVVSDTHGHPDLLEEIIRVFGPGCGALVHCGDGAGDLLQVFSHAGRNVRLAEAFPPVIVPVRGNGDGEWYPAEFLGDSPGGEEPPVRFRFSLAPQTVFSAAGRTVFVTHGHGYSVHLGLERLVNTASLRTADLVLYGHTHRPQYGETAGSLTLNPGSCAYPRGGFPPSFATVAFPGAAERFDVGFYEIRKTRFGGLDFSPFSKMP